MDLTQLLKTGGASALVSDLNKPDNPESLNGKELGGYRILEPIGKGGMSFVYKAKRVGAAFDRTVAVKLIKPSVTSYYTLVQFISEQQILANLHHPYIAQMIDGNVSNDGLPYLIMEFVDGIELTTHLMSEDFDLNSRIDLFLKIASAVQYAHEHQIIHLDIKPSNILIDSQKNPKLLDFGIAKTQSNKHIDHHSTRALTISFASPEQLKQETITYRSDIYQLGFIFFIILTGKHIITTSNKEKIIQEIIRSDFELIRRNNKHLKSSINYNGANKIGLDLKSIVAKCLQDDPNKRYSSVQAMIDDICNAISHKPIIAGEQSSFLKIKKFALRNLTRIYALSFLTFLSIASLYIYFNSIKEERNKSIELVETIEEMFSNIDIYFKGEQEPKLSTIAKLNAHDIIKKINQGNTHYERFLVSLLKPIMSTKDCPAVVDLLSNYTDGKSNFTESKYSGELANIYAYCLYQQGDNEKAKYFFDLSINALIELKLNDETLPVALQRYALFEHRRGDINESIRLFEQAKQLIEKNKLHGTNAHLMLGNNYALALMKSGQNDRAIETFNDAINFIHKYHNNNHPRLSSYNSNLSLAYRKNGQMALSLMAAQKGYEVAVNNEVQYEIGIASWFLAQSYKALDEYNNAIEYFDIALKNFVIARGPDDSKLKIIHKELAKLYININDCESALKHYNEAKRINELKGGVSAIPDLDSKIRSCN